MPKSKKADNSDKYSHNFTKKLIRSSALCTPKVCLICGSPVILLTRLLYYTKCQSRKREIIQTNIYRSLWKVNQVIYTLDTDYMHDPSFSCSPDILLTKYNTMQKSTRGPLVLYRSPECTGYAELACTHAEALENKFDHVIKMVTFKLDKKATIRNWYNRIPHPALNTKRESDTYN